MENTQLKPVKRRFSKPLVIITVFFQIFLSGIICLALVLYSPFFNTIKKFAVESIMETGSHQYLAKMFFTKQEIAAIIGSSKPETSQKITSVTTKNVGDTDIKEETVSSRGLQRVRA